MTAPKITQALDALIEAIREDLIAQVMRRPTSRERQSAPGRSNPNNGQRYRRGTNARLAKPRDGIGKGLHGKKPGSLYQFANYHRISLRNGASL